MRELLHNALEFILGIPDAMIDYATEHQWAETFTAIIVSIIASALTVFLITSLL